MSTSTSGATRHLRGYGHGHHHTHPVPHPAIEGRHGERLLAGWLATGRPADLGDHLAGYGRAPHLAGSGDGHRLIDAVARAGLTGRGGAGFATAVKLRAVAGHRRGERVVVANGMESEPASAKDKALLQLAPHLVLDGLVLAAEAVGAAEAHLCVARDFDRLDHALRSVIEERCRHGLDSIDIRVHTPPHHYVSSEASALVNWLGGGEAKPTTTPPRTSERGVRGLPTLVDNVETLAHLALIARFGPDWFRARGTAQAPGTSLVTIAGAAADRGVYEVSYGTPLPEMLALGGVPRDAQAVLIGGYFGTWVPLAEAVRLRYSPEGLAAVGASLGAGVLAALPAGACGLAETARVLDFLAAHSARQCGPCRFGLPATAEDFSRLAFGGLDKAGRLRLERNVGLLRGRGACKHPDGASQLAASALHAFGAEVRRHLATGPCPAALHGAPLLPAYAEPIPDGAWR
jgi:NADH:ubiquinone oxidoreductase subunit F (NADH-binding)